VASDRIAFVIAEMSGDLSHATSINGPLAHGEAR
jgi:hypothetical protein